MDLKSKLKRVKDKKSHLKGKTILDEITGIDSQSRLDNALGLGVPLHSSKQKRRFILTVYVLLGIAVALIIFILLLNLRFTYTQDLTMQTTPRHVDINVTSQSPVSVKITTDIRTGIFCIAECKESLVDISTKEYLINKSAIFSGDQKIILSRNFSLKYLGEGQDMYMFEITCRTNTTNKCPAGNDSVQRTSIITVTRQLTQREKQLKESQQKEITLAIADFSQSKFMELQAEQIISGLKQAKKDDLQKTFSQNQLDLVTVNKSLSYVVSAWIGRDHELTQLALEKTSLLQASNDLNVSTSNLFASSLYRISEHNYAVNQTYSLANNLAQTSRTTELGKAFVDKNTFDVAPDLLQDDSLLRFTANSLLKKDFSSYQDLFSVLSNINDSLESAQGNYSAQIDNSILFTETDLDIILSDEDSCMTLTPGAPCISDVSQLLFEKNCGCEQNMTCACFDEVSARTQQLCQTMAPLSASIAALKSSVLQKRVNQTPDFLQAVDNEALRVRLDNLNRHKNELSLRNDSFAKNAEQIIDQYISILESSSNGTGITKNSPNTSPGNNTNISIEPNYNVTLSEYFVPPDFLLDKNIVCDSTNSLHTDYVNLSYEEPQSIDPSIIAENILLPNLLPMCCYNNKCDPCLNNSQNENYPIVLVHGHGFYTNNQPASPSDVYNNLVDSLFNDNVAIPAGLLYENETITPRTLGRINKTVVYKMTYYPLNYNNDSESIAIFASRLNKVIEKAKIETGKDKVIIIAHSMGGLVTRKYLKDYGEGSVREAIILGTPDRGVPSGIIPVCKAFGRTTECDEMKENSTFLTGLQTGEKITVPAFTITGVGCNTFGSDGDGIVQSKSVWLNYALNKNFTGNCSGTGDFHVGLPDPAQNPNIYEEIKNILLSTK